MDARRKLSAAVERLARLPRVTGTAHRQAQREAEGARAKFRALNCRLAELDRRLASLPKQRLFAGLSIASEEAARAPRSRSASLREEPSREQRTRQVQAAGRRRLTEDISRYGDPVPDPALMMDATTRPDRNKRGRGRRNKSA